MQRTYAIQLQKLFINNIFSIKIINNVVEITTTPMKLP